MFTIVRARTVAVNIREIVVQAPRIARKQRPGQFVILRANQHGERIPLTIKSADPAAGTISLVVQAVGKTTMLLTCLEAGDAILDVVGPLGRPSEIRNYGTVAILAGSVGTAMALPTAHALKDAGNHVVFIEGARNKDLVIFEDEVRHASHEAFFLTDDCSYGEKGLVTEKLSHLLAAGRKLDFVLAVGPVPMMRAVAQITIPRSVKTVVSLNSIMVDGTGMCGGCRVLLGNTSKFACVDGPEFDAAEVNFEVLMQRNAMYREQERQSLIRFESLRSQELAHHRALLAASFSGGERLSARLRSQQEWRHA